MNKNGINLLPVIPEIRKEIGRKKIIVISTVLLLLFFLVTVVLSFGYLNILIFRIESLKNEVIVRESLIERQREKESLFVGLKTKLVNLSKIISGNPPYKEVLKVLSSITPSDIHINSVSAEVGKDKIIKLSGSADNVESLTMFLDSFKKGKFSVKFSKVFLSGLFQDKTGIYSFSLQLVL